MEILNCKTQKNIEYASWGDLHIGNGAVSMDAISTFIKWVKAKRNRRFSLVGDLIEGKTVNNPHFDIDAHTGQFRGKYEYDTARAAMIQNQCDEVVRLFKPVANKCLFISPGNHERNPAIKNVLNVTKYIGEKLGVKTGGYLNILNFQKCKILETHGTGYSNPKAGDHRQIQTNREIFVKRMLRHLAADCSVSIMHHVHRVIIHKPTISPGLYTRADGEREMIYKQPSKIWIDKEKDIYKIEENDAYYCASGCALRAYVKGMITYAEEKNYPPAEMGAIVVTIKNGDLDGVEPLYL